MFLGVLAGVLMPLPLRAQERAILPVDAPAALAQELNRRVRDQVARQGVDGVLSPTEVLKRLRGRFSENSLLAQARVQIATAGEQTLYMKREQAVSSARAAISALQKLHGTTLYPQLVAQAQEALALALLLRPEDEAGAVAAFRAALDADPAYTPNPNRMTSKVLQLVKQGRRRWRRPRSPSAREMAALARSLDLTQLVRLSVRQTSKGRALSATLFESSGRTVASRRAAAVPPEEMLAKAASLVVQLLDPLRAMVPLAASAAPLGVKVTASSASRGAPPQGDPPRRWYQKWWVWTAVGAVLVGTGVGIAVAVQGEATPPKPGAVDIEFTF